MSAPQTTPLSRPSVRFAPSPTGVFHVGNLRTAWISHALARALDMAWVVRFEDIDRPRVLPGARERQLADMEALGLVPDRQLLQSENAARHEALFRAAVDEDRVYPCACSRREIQDALRQMASAPHEASPLYSGRCRNVEGRPAVREAVAWRFRNPDDPTGAHDFVIGRTDAAGGGFAPAYHWACAIDDYDGDHALLVRAADLAHVIPLQRRVHAWVGEHEGAPRPYPAVFHTALVTDDRGHRLEKRTRGVTLAELVAGGLSPGEVQSRIQRSFDLRWAAEFRPGRVWDEVPAQLSLSDLGLGSTG